MSGINRAPVAGGAGAPSNIITMDYVPGVLVNDAVYQTTTPDTVDRASAASSATSPAIGIVTALDNPSAGKCQVQINGDIGGFSGLYPGKRYILSTSLGEVVWEDDVTNPGYPSSIGNVIQTIGIASRSDQLLLQILEVSEHVNSTVPGITPGDHALETITDYQYSSTLVAFEIQYIRVWVEKGVVITKFKSYVNAVTGGNVIMGLYDNYSGMVLDPSDPAGVPHNQLTDTAATAVTTTGYQAIPAIANYTIPTTGYYWVAHAGSSVSVRWQSTANMPIDFVPIKYQTVGSLMLPIIATPLSYAVPTPVIYAAASE